VALAVSASHPNVSIRVAAVDLRKHVGRAIVDNVKAHDGSEAPSFSGSPPTVNGVIAINHRIAHRASSTLGTLRKLMWLAYSLGFTAPVAQISASRRSLVTPTDWGLLPGIQY
jgi:hypothetical protein